MIVPAIAHTGRVLPRDVRRHPRILALHDTPCEHCTHRLGLMKYATTLETEDCEIEGIPARVRYTTIKFYHADCLHYTAARNGA